MAKFKVTIVFDDQKAVDAMSACIAVADYIDENGADTLVFEVENLETNEKRKIQIIPEI